MLISHEDSTVTGRAHAFPALTAPATLFLRESPKRGSSSLSKGVLAGFQSGANGYLLAFHVNTQYKNVILPDRDHQGPRSAPWMETATLRQRIRQVGQKSLNRLGAYV